MRFWLLRLRSGGGCCCDGYTTLICNDPAGVGLGGGIDFRRGRDVSYRLGSVRRQGREFLTPSWRGWISYRSLRPCARTHGKSLLPLRFYILGAAAIVGRMVSTTGAALKRVLWRLIAASAFFCTAHTTQRDGNAHCCVQTSGS